MKYSNPPVVETVLSVQFAPLNDFGAGHLGAFWKSLGPDWPHVTDAPSVDPQHEKFESTAVWERESFLRFTSKIDLRLQIRNKLQDRMIQIQNGRFFYNWLGTEGGDYPSYETVRPEFDGFWNKFREFILSECETDTLQPNQWEVLYVNHIPCDTVWKDLADLPETLSFLRSPDFSDIELGLDRIGGEWRYEIGYQQGRLYISLGTKVNKEDNSPYVVMNLTARGPIQQDGISLDQGLELGHTVITSAFDRITSKQAQSIWGVNNAS